MNIQVNWLNEELATTGQIMPEDLDKLKEQLIKLKAFSEDEHFWSDNVKAKKVMVEINEVEQNINLVAGYENRISEVNDYFK